LSVSAARAARSWSWAIALGCSRELHEFHGIETARARRALPASTAQKQADTTTLLRTKHPSPTVRARGWPLPPIRFPGVRAPWC